MIKRISLFLAVICFSLGAVSAQDFSEAAVKAKLTSHDWGFVYKIKKRMQETPPSCEADNIFRFNADGTFEFSEGASKCDTSDPDVFRSGEWEYDEGLRYVYLKSGGETIGWWGINRLTDGAMDAFISYLSSNENGSVRFLMKSI